MEIFSILNVFRGKVDPIKVFHPVATFSSQGSETGDRLFYLLFFAAMFYIYIIYSESADKYYVGHSDDPSRRIFEHNNTDELTYTSKHRLWRIVFKYPVSEIRSEAIKIERYLKKRKSRSLLETLISRLTDLNYLEEFFNKILKKINT